MIKDVVPLSLMSRYLDQEVNVIFHDGQSIWQKLTDIASNRIRLREFGWIAQPRIRSFGTQQDGLLYEVSTDA